MRGLGWSIKFDNDLQSAAVDDGSVAERSRTDGRRDQGSGAKSEWIKSDARTNVGEEVAA